jgi:hypothetical protein
MKWCALATCLFASLSFASHVKVIPASIDHIFVPKGFDSNDTIEVVVSGSFADSCHGRNGVTVEKRNQQVVLNMIAVERTPVDPEQCLSMKIPFMETVNLGQLDAGTYQVISMVNGKVVQAETLTVTEPLSEAVDNHIYAMVERIDFGFTGGLGGEALLIAQAPSSCIELDHVEYLSNGRDTLSILPIMKKVSEVCDENQSRFVIPIKYDLGQFNHTELLLSVRSIDGRSVNALISKE